MANAEAGRAIIRLSHVLAAIAALAVAAVGALYERQGGIVHRQEERGDAFSAVSVVRSQLQGALDSDHQHAQGLVGIIEYEPAMTPAEFGRLAARMLRGREGIRTLAAAPDLVVSMVYPPGAGELLGHSHLATPGGRRATLMARALGTTALSGPIELAGGGHGFIARVPVFVDGESASRRFWGLVSMAIERDALYRSGGLLDADLPVDLAVVARDDVGSQPRVIFGDETVLDRDPVRTEVALPIGHWTLAAVPKGGWTSPDLWPQRLLLLLAGLLVVLPILAAGRLVASRQVRLAEIRVREAELSRLSWRLEFALAASSIGVWDVDIATDKLLWDKRARELFGFPSARDISASRTGSGRSIPTTAPARSPRRARRRRRAATSSSPFTGSSGRTARSARSAMSRGTMSTPMASAAWSASSGTSPPTSSARRSSTSAAARRKRRPTRSRASSRR